MSDKTFHIIFDGHVTFSVDDVWPDGDAPDNPTADDVAEVMRSTGEKWLVMREWGLNQFVNVSVDHVEVWP